jgi:hypothetical protein
MKDDQDKKQWISVVLGDGKTWSNIEGCKIIACDKRAQEIWEGCEDLSYIHTEGATIIDVADLMSACIDIVDTLNIRLWGDTANDIQGGVEELIKNEE